jgi:3-mercaptopyruvate sulfurtransferase SseA
LPFFALRYLLGYPDVRVHLGSLLEWQRDDRGLPMWTYAEPLLLRDADWVHGWGGAMLRSVGVSQLSVVDLRPAAAYAQGHLPFALHLPAESFRAHLRDPAALAPALGAAGVDPEHEVVLVSDGGLTTDAALAYAVLQALGQPRISILKESVDEWALRGHPLAKAATVVGQRRSPQDQVVPARTYVPRAAPGALLRPANDGLYPRLWFAPGRQPSTLRPDGPVVHLPFTDLLQADGQPLAAHALWTRLDKAGLSRWAEVVCIADDPAEAAAGAWLLRLMGFPDVRVAV